MREELRLTDPCYYEKVWDNSFTEELTDEQKAAVIIGTTKGFEDVPVLQELLPHIKNEDISTAINRVVELEQEINKFLADDSIVKHIITIYEKDGKTEEDEYFTQHTSFYDIIESKMMLIDEMDFSIMVKFIDFNYNDSETGIIGYLVIRNGIITECNILGKAAVNGINYPLPTVTKPYEPGNYVSLDNGYREAIVIKDTITQDGKCDIIFKDEVGRLVSEKVYVTRLIHESSIYDSDLDYISILLTRQYDMGTAITTMYNRGLIHNTIE